MPEPQALHTDAISGSTRIRPPLSKASEPSVHGKNVSAKDALDIAGELAGHKL